MVLNPAAEAGFFIATMLYKQKIPAVVAGILVYNVNKFTV